MRRLLVVDDEPAIRSLITATLAGSDWQITAVSDGVSAIDSAHLIPPDLILLDVGLPGISGIEVLARLRSQDDTAGVPVVFLTGLAPQLGPVPDGLLVKPFTPATLRETIDCFAAPSTRLTRPAGRATKIFTGASNVERVQATGLGTSNIRPLQHAKRTRTYSSRRRTASPQPAPLSRTIRIRSTLKRSIATNKRSCRDSATRTPVVRRRDRG